jgi:SAM-dependent methyltransferase
MDTKTIIEIYKKYSNELPVIDIGAGWWPRFDFEHVRFDKASILDGAKTCANHFGDFHDMADFKDNTFSFVNANQVIEHAKYPEIALKEWIRILKIGGILNLNWPAELEKLNNLDAIKDLRYLEDAIEGNNLDRYISVGGNVHWLSKDKDGNYFLDGHYNIMSLEEMKQILPKNIIILEEHWSGCIISKKVR